MAEIESQCRVRIGADAGVPAVRLGLRRDIEHTGSKSRHGIGQRPIELAPGGLHAGMLLFALLPLRLEPVDPSAPCPADKVRPRERMRREFVEAAGPLLLAR